MKSLLFKPEMIKAILDGNKNQTRRIMKPQPVYSEGMKKWVLYPSQHPTVYADLINVDKYAKYQPGDIVYVKEAWATQRPYMGPGDETPDWCNYIYKLDNPEPNWRNGKWQSPLFMPEVVARIFLEITQVRVERLNDISEEDCVNEGIEALPDFNIESYGRYGWRFRDYIEPTCVLYPKDSYKSLWESINGIGSWEKNEWVFVYNFKQINKS